MAFNKQQLVKDYKEAFGYSRAGKDRRLLHPRLRGCQMWLSSKLRRGDHALRRR